MRVGLAILTIAAGAVATAVWLPGSMTGNELAVVTGVDAGGVARLSAPPAQRTVGADAVGTAEPSAPRFFGFALPKMLSETGKPDGGSPKVASAQHKSSSQGWAVEVVPGPKEAAQANRPATLANGPATVVPVPALATPQRDRPRPELVRDIQRELKRVGCYAGDVDGEWGAGSRRAVQAFMERVNSTVPNDEPDLIQLTLVRGYFGVACARQCPADRMQPGSGRCLEGPTMATRPAPRVIEERAVAVRPASGIVTGSTVPHSGAMPTAPRTPAVPVPESVAATPATVEPIEGRMSVGAPPAPVETTLAPVVSGVTAPRVARPSPPPRSQATAQRRRDKSWTRTFFNN